MAGRYGNDSLSRFLIFAALVPLVVSLLIGGAAGGSLGTVLWVIAFAIIIYSNYRTFSRDIQRRAAENSRFLELKSRFFRFFKKRREQFRQRRDYKFFRCPGCKATLRVPRNRGKIQIRCSRCGNAFIRKT